MVEQVGGVRFPKKVGIGKGYWSIFFMPVYIQDGPKKVSHRQFFKKIVLKIAKEIRFLRKVKV